MPDSQNLQASNKLVQVVCLLAFLPFVDVGSMLVIKAINFDYSSIMLCVAASCFLAAFNSPKRADPWDTLARVA